MLTAARLTEPHKSHTDLKMKNCTRTVDKKRYSPDAIGEIAARCKVAGISFYPLRMVADMGSLAATRIKRSISMRYFAMLAGSPFDPSLKVNDGAVGSLLVRDSPIHGIFRIRLRIKIE